VRLADFGNPKEAESLINAWVSDQTEAMIPKLLDGDVNAETVLVLVNAIYFDAAWTTPFQKSATKPGAFHRAGGGDVSAEMMHGGQQTRYVAGDGYEAVEIPYAGTPVSMVVVMPTEGTADAFGEALDADALKGIVDSMQVHTVDLTMPKFSFRSGASLKATLIKMGMGVAFGESADFSGMLAGGDIHIQDVIHQAVIDVDEAGTKAAAATAVIFGSSGTGEFPEPATIVLDHPFYFYITDLPSGAVLFAGRLNDPTAH
jgi:serpin B